MVAGFEIGRDGPLRILVGVDGSPPSLRAGAYAAGLARRQASQLVVLYVAANSSLAAMAPTVTAAEQQTLDEIAAEIRAEVAAGARHVGVDAKFVGARGDPYTEICRVADEERADALVVGASAAAGHRFVGSLAVRLVRAGRWPVTVVP